MHRFDDDDDYDMREQGGGEISDADSDDLRLRDDIAKLDGEVEKFQAMMGHSYSDSESDYDSMVNPSFSGGKRKPKDSSSGRPKKRGRRPGAPRADVEPSAEIKILLQHASNELELARNENALQILSEIVRRNAEIYEAWSMMVTVYENQGRDSEAVMARAFAAHLRPRDFYGWMSCAQYALDDQTGDRERNVDIAQSCYSGAIRAKSNSLKARVGKANCALELGRSTVAVAEYCKILKRRPYDMAVLKNLAEAAFDTKNARRWVERAKGFYEQAIAHVRAGGRLLKGDFDLSAVVIYVEMCAFLEMYSDAALVLRSLTRMLAGRQDEIFWDRYVDDDREWDRGEDRKRVVPEYAPGRYDPATYGPALPLELRTKLAIYRLKLGHEEEATRHLQWLIPAPDLHDYFDAKGPFVIRELADQLFENRRITNALEYYAFYEQLTGELDSELLVQKGKCYLQMEDQQTAEDFFIQAIEADDDNIDARYELAQMYETHQEEEEAFLLVNEAMKLAQARQQEDEEDEEYAGAEDEDPAVAKARQRRRIRRKIMREKHKGQKPQRAKRQYIRRLVGKAKREQYEQNVTEVFRDKYHKVRELRARMGAGDLEAEDEWMAAAQDLVDDFRSFKEFYPWDKYLSFMGYGSFFQENMKKAQEKSAAGEAGQGEVGERAQSRAGTVAPQDNPGLVVMAERLQHSKSNHPHHFSMGRRTSELTADQRPCPRR